jgi:hypothetical protein
MIKAFCHRVSLGIKHGQSLLTADKKGVSGIASSSLSLEELVQGYPFSKNGDEHCSLGCRR